MLCKSPDAKITQWLDQCSTNTLGKEALRAALMNTTEYKTCDKCKKGCGWGEDLRFACSARFACRPGAGDQAQTLYTKLLGKRCTLYKSGKYSFPSVAAAQAECNKFGRMCSGVMEAKCGDPAGKSIVCAGPSVGGQPWGQFARAAALSTGPDGFVDTSCVYSKVLPGAPQARKPVCKSFANTVWAMCGATQFKSWGVGPEGAATAVGNCQFAVRTNRDGWGERCPLASDAGWSTAAPGYCKESQPDRLKNSPGARLSLDDCKRLCKRRGCSGISHFDAAALNGWANKCFLDYSPSCTPVVSMDGAKHYAFTGPHVDKDECQRRCVATPGCAGFDYANTDLSSTSGNLIEQVSSVGKCRLFKENAPNYGARTCPEGGTYVSMTGTMDGDRCTAHDAPAGYYCPTGCSRTTDSKRPYCLVTGTTDMCRQLGPEQATDVGRVEGGAATWSPPQVYCAASQASGGLWSDWYNTERTEDGVRTGTDR